MNADKVVSGIGGEILGYNLYSYCFNNPVNMYDSSGQRPVVVDELAARSKYTISWITRTIVSPLKALQVSLGMGIGFDISVGIDFRAWCNELIDIFDDPYTDYY